MQEAVVEKESCWNCGAERRPDTQFCYNCGKSLDDPPDPADSRDAAGDDGLADLEKALAAEFPTAEDPKARLDQAAEERRRARRRSKKEIEIVWEPPDGSRDRIYMLFVLMIFVFAAAIVFVTYLSR